MGFKTNSSNLKKGFTIVELLIVIIIIAILAAITVVGYGAVTKRATAGVIQSSLQSIAQKVANQKTLNADDQYATTFPEGVTPSDGTGFAFTYVASTSEFCINGTTSRYDDVVYHIDQTMTIKEGLCEGQVIEESIIGEYNESAGQATPADFSTVATADGVLGFTISTDSGWDNVSVDWEGHPDAVTYDFQSRTSSSADWYYRSRAAGSGNCWYKCQNGGTNTINLPNSVKGYTWSSTSVLPDAAGENFEYRLRYRDADGVYSEWEYAYLAYPIQASTDIPEVTGFTVANNPAWSSVSISWDQVPNFDPNMGEVKYNLETRNISDSDWYYRNVTDGSGNCWYKCENAGTNSINIPHDTLGFDWSSTSVLPSRAGQTFEYRIRVKVQGASTYYSDYTYGQLAYPIQSTTDIPEVTNFTASSAGGTLTLSWDQVPDFDPNMGEVKYDLETRDVDDGSWYYRQQADGSENCWYKCENSGTHSINLSHTTTGFTWTSDRVVPDEPGEVFEYRIRVKAVGESTYYGDWVTISLP